MTTTLETWMEGWLAPIGPGANGQAGQPGKTPPSPESKVIRKTRNMTKILNGESN